MQIVATAGFISVQGFYYECDGNPLNYADVSVPLRPSPLHVWEAKNGWTIDPAAKQSADSAVAAAKEEEDNIAALRSMRKVLSAVPLPLGTAPDILAAQVALKE